MEETKKEETINECKGCGCETKENLCPLCKTSRYLIKKPKDNYGKTTKFVL